MEHETSTMTIIINVAVQVANIVIFFLVFKFLLGDKVSKELEEREKMIGKLKNAEEQYQKMVSDANKKSEEIISQSVKHREQVLLEAGAIANKKREEVLQEANREAQIIIEKAKLNAVQLTKELEENFEEGVKRASTIAVKKLIGSDSNLQKQYIDSIVKEAISG